MCVSFESVFCIIPEEFQSVILCVALDFLSLSVYMRRVLLSVVLSLAVDSKLFCSAIFQKIL